jgi:hypothetical protein
MPKYFHYSLIFFLSFLSSCKFYYKTSEVNAKLNASVSSVNAQCNEVIIKINTLQGAFASIPCKAENEPFKSAMLLSEEINLGKATITKELKIVNEAHASFKESTKGKETISSRTPEWEVLKTTKKSIKKTLKSLQKNGATTIETATIFNKYLNEYLGVIVKICQTSTYVIQPQSSLNQYKKIKENLLIQTKEFSIKIAAFEQKYGKDFPNQVLEIKNDLTIISSSIALLDRIYTKANEAIQTFVNKTANLPTIYSCAEEWVLVTDLDEAFQKSQTEIDAIQFQITTAQNHIQTIFNQMNK